MIISSKCLPSRTIKTPPSTSLAFASGITAISWQIKPFCSSVLCSLLLIVYLILTACQPIWGYFMPRCSEIAYVYDGISKSFKPNLERRVIAEYFYYGNT